MLAEDATAREKVGAKRSVEIEDSDEAPRISYIENESLMKAKLRSSVCSSMSAP